jgi:hypothetical protein
MLGRSHCRSGQLGNREQMVVLRICTLFVEPSHTLSVDAILNYYSTSLCPERSHVLCSQRRTPDQEIMK